MSGNILLFGRLKDVFGGSTLPLPPDVDTVAALRAKLAALHPDLADMLHDRTIRIAVNQELVADEAAVRISARDEIALLPPLSGG